MPSIEEIRREDVVKNIWVVDNTTPTGSVEEGESEIKKNKRKRQSREGENIKAAKKAIIHDEVDRQVRVHKMESGDRSFTPSDVADLISSILYCLSHN